MKRVLATLSAYVVSLLVASAQGGVTLYVNAATGDDSRTKTTAQNPATPWATIHRAAKGAAPGGGTSSGQAAAAGDTVIVAAGAYTGSAVGNRYINALNPVNSGMPGARIVFQCETRWTCSITWADNDQTLESNTHKGPLIGCDQVDYITWDGFAITEPSALVVHGDTGGVVAHESEGCVIANLDYQGVDQTYNHGEVDNRNAVRFEAVLNPVLRNSRIRTIGLLRQDTGYTQRFTSPNSAGVTFYDVQGALIEHNEFADVGSCIHIKGDHTGDGWPQQDNVVRLNLCTDVYAAGMRIGPATTNDRIYQNIVTGCGQATEVQAFTIDSGAGPSATGTYLVNNAVYNCDYGLMITNATSGLRVFNNIFSTLTNAIAYSDNFPTAFPSAAIEIEHGVYHNYPGNFGLGTSISWSAWQSSPYSHDTVSPAGVQNSSPQFVDAAAGDFHLQAGSPALNRGIDILDLDGDASTSDTIHAGPYVTGDEVVGMTGGNEPEPPTPAPGRGPVLRRLRLRLRVGLLDIPGGVDTLNQKLDRHFDTLPITMKAAMQLARAR